MRDIVLKPITQPLTVSQPDAGNAVPLKVSGVPANEKVLKPNRLKSLLIPKQTLTLVTAARSQTATPLPIIRKPYVLPVIVSQFRPQRERLVQQMNTPLGRVTVLQGIALVALFAFVLSSNHKNIPQSSFSSSALAAPSGLRQFLPTSSEAEASLGTPSVLSDVATSGSLSIWAAPWNIDSIGKSTIHYKYVSAFWLDMAADSRSVTPKANWAAWDAYRKAVATTNTEYYLTISADPNLSSKMLQEPALRDAHIAALLAQVQTHAFDGIDIDYEGLGKERSTEFTNFIHSLTQKFHAQNKKVSVTVEARISNDVPMDWHALGQQADQVRIMAYDYHARETGTPGPISPLGWVQEITQYATNQIDPRKTVIGLGDYGYDWTEPQLGASSWEGVGVSREQALALAKTYNQSINRQTGIDMRGYDIGSIPQFKYTDATGKQHQVWYEDADSLQAKTIVVQQYHPTSVILWTAGLAQAVSVNQKGPNE